MNGLKTFEFMGQMGFTRSSLARLTPAQKFELIQAGANASTLFDKGIQVVRKAVTTGEDIITLSSRETGERLAILTKGEKTNFLISLYGKGKDIIEALKDLFGKVDEKTLVESTGDTNRAIFEIPKLDLTA